MEECHSQNKYIGYTEQTIRSRFRQHKSVTFHPKKFHQITKDLLPKITILIRANNKRDLKILEALQIKIHKPNLNSQEEGKD